MGLTFFFPGDFFFSLLSLLQTLLHSSISSLLALLSKVFLSSLLTSFLFFLLIQERALKVKFL